MAEITEKNKELEHIVYVSSHDLRSPLVNIQGFSKELNYSLQEMASILQHEEISQEVRDKLSPIVQTDIADSLMYIQASVLKMDSLLSGLLRLSRLGRAALNMEKLDVAGMVSEIIKGNEYRIKSAKVTVEAGDLPPCTGDSVQINQVLSNLVDNALKYLDHGRPGTIRITGRTEGDRSVYCVEDNGIGIADEDREKVFEIFKQLNPGTSPGEGLGLAVVKKILSRNDGRIWVESQPGVGSRFFVSLPGSRENESGGKGS
jgi:signal transduction histidine kinase